LHAGLGMALAHQLLRRLAPASPAAAFDAALRSFLELVEQNSRPAYAIVPVEALGLMVRLFQPRIFRAVERQLRAIDPGLTSYYWHGAGRAIFFLPAQFHPFPGAIDGGLEICRREPPEPALRQDALSGFSFAAVMTDLRHPRSLEPLLGRLSERPEEAEALASGAAGAVLTLLHTTPDDPAIAAFLAYRPPASETSRSELWQRWVAGPSAFAVELYPLLAASGQLGVFARHQSPGSLESLGSLRSAGSLASPQMLGPQWSPESPVRPDRREPGSR
jgi:hypothetical protein